MSEEDCGVGHYFEETIEQCFPCEHICGSLWEACIRKGCKEYWERRSLTTEIPYKYVSTLGHLDLIIGVSIGTVVVCIGLALIIFITVQKTRKHIKKKKEKVEIDMEEKEVLEDQSRPFLSNKTSAELEEEILQSSRGDTDDSGHVDGQEDTN